MFVFVFAEILNVFSSQFLNKSVLFFVLFLSLQAFTASSILRTHIRQHSGERPFKCKHCGKAFASHAAHDSHVRRTHAREKSFPCEMCGAAFQDEQELKFHIKSHKSKGFFSFLFYIKSTNLRHSSFVFV